MEGKSLLTRLILNKSTRDLQRLSKNGTIDLTYKTMFRIIHLHSRTNLSYVSYNFQYFFETIFFILESQYQKSGL